MRAIPRRPAVGEAAGTHGVTRPGGAALNAGQVFAARCGEHIAACAAESTTSGGKDVGHAIESLVAQALDAVHTTFKEDGPLDVATIKQQVQARMSEHAGMICRAADVKMALAAARQLNDLIRRQGIAVRGSVYDAAQAMQWSQMALASEAVLASLDFYLSNGGGSRGARMVCDPSGTLVPDTVRGPLDEMRFHAESEQHRDQQLLVSMTSQGAEVRMAALRGVELANRPSFERHWPDFLTGRIYQ